MYLATSLFWALSLSSCNGTLPVHASPSLQEQVAGGGTIRLPAGTVEVPCSGQLAISKSTTLIGAGRDLTVLHDSCPNGDTLLVDLTQPANVRVEELSIVHDGGNSAVHLIGGNHGFVPILQRTLRLTNVELSGATNYLITDGLNLLSVEKSNVINCSQDGAQIGSFGVTLRDNWFGSNGRNGVTFIDSSVTDELGQHVAGFCASCSGNEFWFNKGHGLVYNVTGISDARHIGDYIDSNGDVGLVVHGVRDFTFNDGWIGSNRGGGAVIDDSTIGTVIVGNTFTANAGPNLIVTEISGPLQIKGNISSLLRDPCDTRINGGPCFDLNTR